MRNAQEIGPDKVAIYIRWSTEDQAEGTTLDVQRETCRAYVVSQGWVVNPALIFIDDGISGSILDRPALNSLRDRVRAGEIDCIVVYKLDRLSRSVVDTVKLVLDEWDGRCYIKSAREPIDTITQAGKMFFYQLVSFAEWERSVIKERTFAGKLRRAHEGRNPGATAAFGYRLGAHSEFIIEPSEATVVQLIYRLYLAGLGGRNISKKLHELGHTSATGRRWSESQLNRVLKNPIYKGTFVYGKNVTVRGKRIKSDQPLVVKEGMAPIIIEPETFRAVQSMIAGRPHFGQKGQTGRTVSSLSLLTGMLRCPCGRMYFTNGGNSARVQYRYYCCGGAHSLGKDFCASGRIRQDLLDSIVIGELTKRFGGREQREIVVATVTQLLEAGVREAKVAFTSISKELSKLNDKETRLKALFLDSDISASEYRELKTALANQQTQLQEQLTRQKVSQNEALIALDSQQQRLFLLDEVHRWDVLDLRERKELIRHFVSEVVAYRHKKTGEVECSLAWKWPTGNNESETILVTKQNRFTQASLDALRS